MTTTPPNEVEKRYEETEEFVKEQDEQKKFVSEMGEEMKFHMLMKGMLDQALAGNNVMVEMGKTNKLDKCVTVIFLAGEYSEELMHKVIEDARKAPVSYHDENGDPVAAPESGVGNVQQQH